MDLADVPDDAGFSSFFIDYKHPSLKNEVTKPVETLSINKETFSTPPDTSTSSPSTSSLSLFTATLTPAQATRTLVLKRKLFDNNQEELKAAIALITDEERHDLEDIETFAAYFKKQRMQYGCTQHDIGVALGRKYGTEFSQTTISRFEALNLSFKNMCKLRPLLKEWLEEVDHSMAQGLSINEFLQRTPVSLPSGADKTTNGKSKKGEKNDGRQRKRRTFIDEYQSVKLVEEYELNNRPTGHQLTDLADRLKLDKDVVRIWFSNHRQKIRKIEDEKLTLEMHNRHDETENINSSILL